MHSFLIFFLILGCFEASAYKVLLWKPCAEPQAGKVTSLESSEPCDSHSCQLKRGTNVTFIVHFTAGENAAKATAKVYGDIEGVKIKFNLPNEDACKNCGLTCPLKSGGSYSYHSVVPVLKMYPKIRLVVIWYLLDENNKTIWCVDLPAVISD